LSLLAVFSAGFGCLTAGAQTASSSNGEPVPGLRMTAGTVRSGNPAAPVKIEIFYDLTCPACARFHKIVRETEEAYKGKIYVIFRQWPLFIQGHEKSIKAARVVEAANLQGKGREMLDLVLEKQKTWSTTPGEKAIFFEYARKLGLDMKKFGDDYDDDLVIRPIIEDSVRASSLKLSYTPTIYVNGIEWSFADALDLKNKVKQFIQ